MDVSVRKFARICTVAVLVAGLTGCAGTVAMKTKQSDRDRTGAFDGVWQVDVQKSAGLQYVGNWQVQCGDMRQVFSITVADGTVGIKKGDGVIKAYVSDKGQFKLFYPLDTKAKASGASSTTMTNGDSKIILRGRLGDNTDGYITYGVAEVGYSGCTAKTKFNKVKSIPKGSSV